MSRHYLFKTVCLMGLLMGLGPAFAIEAPVYEADDYGQESGDQGQGGALSAPSSADSSGLTSSTDDETPSPSLTQGQRIDRLEQQLDNVQHSDVSGKFNHVQEEVQALRGKLDELSHRLDQMQLQQQTMYTDLDRRIAARSTPPPVSVRPTSHKKSPTPPAITKPVTATKATQPNVAEEQDTYQRAYDLIKAEKYDQAISTLKTMLHKYPSGQFAANAHYWLGELYGLQGKNAESAVEFQTVLKQYPGSPRIADAGLKLGLIYVADLKWHEAKGAFRHVINRYPGTSSARLASEQLKQIKQMGH